MIRTCGNILTTWDFQRVKKLISGFLFILLIFNPKLDIIISVKDFNNAFAVYNIFKFIIGSHIFYWKGFRPNSSIRIDYIDLTLVDSLSDYSSDFVKVAKSNLKRFLTQIIIFETYKL